MARAAERSQFVANFPVPERGRLSVWPSTRSTQGMSGGIFVMISASRSRPCRARACLPASAPPGRDRRRPPIGTRSGRRRCGCRGGCREYRAAGRRNPSDSARAPATFCASATLRREPRSAMRVCASCSRVSDAWSARFDRRELAAQRGDLLVQRIDLRERPAGVGGLRLESALELSGAALGRVRGAAARVHRGPGAAPDRPSPGRASLSARRSRRPISSPSSSRATTGRSARRSGG